MGFKIPAGSEANQLAIYKHDRTGVEQGSTEKQLQLSGKKWS